jgi:hypothetical protein
MLKILYKKDRILYTDVYMYAQMSSGLDTLVLRAEWNQVNRWVCKKSPKMKPYPIFVLINTYVCTYVAFTVENLAQTFGQRLYVILNNCSK